MARMVIVMGWELRGNGMYYYTARRAGRKVIKEYVPMLVAPLAALADREQRSERDAAAAELRAARVELDALAAELAALDAMADAVAAATLLTAGYHRHHRGPWRKHRA